MKRFSKQLSFFVVASLVATAAMAGSGGTEFDTALTTVVDWFEGALGKLIAVTTLGVGHGPRPELRPRHHPGSGHRQPAGAVSIRRADAALARRPLGGRRGQPHPSRLPTQQGNPV